MRDTIPNHAGCHRTLQGRLAVAISLALSAMSVAARPPLPSLPTVTHDVTSCEDNGNPGTLRSVIADSMTASGHTVNLASLPISCSVITLGAEIEVGQNSLQLTGPTDRTLTIDGSDHSRVFNHTGSGTLDISNLQLAHGHVDATADAQGGCIRSDGSVVLRSSEVTGCYVSGDARALGGAVYTAADFTMSGSRIVDCGTYSSARDAAGGGAYVRGHFSAKYSAIGDNFAERNSPYYIARGGGVFVLSGSSVMSTTFENNSADRGGGLFQAGNVASATEIRNSTFSGNVATSNYAGGIYSTTPLTIQNSTIAFNRAPARSLGAGLHITDTSLEISSTIISGNEGLYGEDDFGVLGNATIVGMSINNLIVTTTGALAPPLDTKHDCPKLQPLRPAGATSSHSIAHDSAAVDTGANPASLPLDQRGLPRESGPAADIGSVELQPGELDERLVADGFDGICDR